MTSTAFWEMESCLKLPQEWALGLKGQLGHGALRTNNRGFVITHPDAQWKMGVLTTNGPDAGWEHKP